MKNILFPFLALALIVAACSPKTSDKTAAATTKPAASIGKAPQIPIPAGDVRRMAPTPGTPPKIQIGNAETFKLDNGLTVIVVENHKLPRVSYQVYVDKDPILEKEAAGYLDMMGELLAKGTATRTKAQIDEQVDFIGATLNTSQNGVNGTCLRKHSDKLLGILADVLLNPVFPQEELDKSLKRAESNLAAQKDNPDAIAANVSAVLRYGKDHPYGEVMTESSLPKISLERIKQHHSQYFKPNISYLVITGDISKAEAMKQAKQYFGKWGKAEVPQHQYGIPRAPEKTELDFVHKPGAVQSVINITYPVDLQPGTPDVIRARVTNAILGGYFSSRVNANLREGHGWAYGASTTLSPDELVGYFTASAKVRNAVTDSSIIELLKEMRRMAEEKVDKEELQVVKNVIAGQFSISLEQAGTVAAFALNTHRYKLAPDYYEKYLEVLQNVSAEEVQAMAKKYIRPDKAHILVVGNREEVAEKLKQFSADGKIRHYDYLGNPVNLSNAKVPAGLTAEQVIEDFLTAMGGRGKINEIKDMQTLAVMQMRGPSFDIKTYQKGGDKILIEMSMKGQVMNKRLYDGVNASQSAMGQQEALEGEDLIDMKEQARFVKEANYQQAGYKLTLKGIEEINGRNAYRLEVERPDGKQKTEYYDVQNGLKVREVSTGQGVDGNPTTQIVDLENYQEVQGIKIPHGLTVSGVYPVPFKLTLQEIKINVGLEDSTFKL